MPRGPLRIVAYGDSNTAGFGVRASDNYPSQLERVLQARGHAVEVVNSGVSGDTTGKALARFDRAVPEGTDLAIVFLGRNDVRFLVSDRRMRGNLSAIVGALRERDVEVILAGFPGKDLSEIAAAHGAAYYPDFFAGVATQGVKDGQYTLWWDVIRHFNARGYGEIVKRLTPVVERQATKVYCQRAGDSAVLYPECRPLRR